MSEEGRQSVEEFLKEKNQEKKLTTHVAKSRERTDQGSLGTPPLSKRELKQYGESNIFD